VWQAASEEMYKASQSQSAQPGPETENASAGQDKAKGEQQVTDVDFEEVK
jgi:hypothetical protein